MSSKILIALGVILVIVALGAIAMFTISHLSAKSGAQVAKVECIQGDQKADKEAAALQHQADVQRLSDMQTRLQEAQGEAATARALADAATAKAAALSATLERLKRSDISVQHWADQELPAPLRAALQGSK